MASELLLRSDCGQKTIRARKKDLPQEQNPAICGVFKGALGRTRTCDLLIRSHSPSQTGTDIEGQGETKQRFIENLGLLRDTEGQGETPGCGQIAVRKLVA